MENFFRLYMTLLMLMSTSSYATNNLITDNISYSKKNAENYAKFEIEGTSLLAFRDIPKFIKKYKVGKKTLDFGCGAGRSTRFLQSLGFDVVGVDISEKYLQEACSKDKKNHYFLMSQGKIPVMDNSYDFVFSSFVLLMMPTKDDLKETLKEIHRVLKKDGIFIAITGSEILHSPDRKWISYETNFIENKNPKPGERVKLTIKKLGVTFYDYNWSNEDYSKVFTENGFEILETHYPIGTNNDGYKWLSEKHDSPYIIYVIKKV